MYLEVLFYNTVRTDCRSLLSAVFYHRTIRFARAHKITCTTTMSYTTIIELGDGMRSYMRANVVKKPVFPAVFVVLIKR